MKVYILRQDAVWDWEDVTDHPSIQVFFKYKDAKAELKRIYKKASSEDCFTYNCFSYERVEEKGKDYFSIYEDGCWSTNHFDASIGKYEVK